MTPCDLHALGTPPALILSQDQTLHQLCWHPRAGDPDREIHQPPAMPVVSVLTRGLVTSHHQLRSPGSGQPAPASSRVLARLQSPQDSRPQKDRAFGFASSSAHKPNPPQVQPLVCPLVKVRTAYPPLRRYVTPGSDSPEALHQLDMWRWIREPPFGVSARRSLKRQTRVYHPRFGLSRISLEEFSLPVPSSRNPVPLGVRSGEFSGPR